MGLTERTVGLRARGVATTLLASEAGEGHNSFAPEVGERGVGKPGYFLPTSVKSDKCGFIALG